MKPLIVLTTVPDPEAGERIARSLIERRLAACVSILAPCQSVYRWEGLVEATNEVPLLIKTTAGRYAQVEETIREQHPYELPEIVALVAERGLAAYLDWIAAEVAVPKDSARP